MQKSSAMECLYEDGKKAHVKFACFFGWIERFCEAFKNPIVKPDSTLLTFERYVEREARFVPRALQSMEFWEGLRDSYIKKYNARGLPEPPQIPSEAAAIVQSSDQEKKEHPLEKFILTEDRMKGLDILTNDFDERIPFREKKTKDTMDVVVMYVKKKKVPTATLR
eukprot:TRINITY_DN310_c0_g1_i1.p1 TRINITY_DN310_c0_g1~~TRINITY_DN310_c0_g1_i1.p1  ORF type:complete len:166 (-),score=43.62 TRINITY_DN310_c0_g1_i1:35-532(-)